MHFTAKQIEEIKQRLNTDAIKDTDLPIKESIDTEDYVPIIADGKNQTVQFSKIEEKVSSDIPLKTINGESVKGSGNINTDAIEIQNSPRLVAAGDVFDEYFGASAYDLLKRGICGFSGDSEEDFKYIYYKISGTFPLEDLGDGPTVVFDDGTTRSTITTRDEDGTIYVESLSEEPSKVELQQSLTPGSSTKAPSVNAVKNRIEPIEAKIPAEASSSNKLADKAYVDGKVAVVDEKVGDIEDIIPDQATPLNKLADKAFVNSSVQTATANFRGTWTNLIAIPSNPNWYPADYAGNHTPTVNDYLVVQDILPSEYQWEANHQYSVGQFVFDDQGDFPAYYHCIQAVSSSVIPDEDEEHWEVWFYADAYDGEGITGTWRFKYTGNWDTNGKFGWQPEYQVNEEPFTMAQLAAINSGATAEKIARYDGYAQSKQDKLIDELNIKSVNGQAIMGSGTLPLLNQSLNEIEITNVERGVIYQAFVGGPSLICAELGLDESVSFSVFNPSNYPCELDLYAAEDDPEASDIITMEPFEWMEINGANVDGSIDWDVIQRSSTTKEVFVATYGQTSFQDVYNNAQNRQVVAVEGNSRYLLQSIDSNAAYFFGVTNEWSYVVQLLASGVWRHMADYKQERQSNKLTTAPSSSDLASTSKYPSMFTMNAFVGTSKDVFVAKQGETTLAEIDAALNEGKAIIVVRSDGRVFPLAYVTQTDYFFTNIYANYLYRLGLSRTTGQWAGPNSFLLQTASDRQTTDPTAADLDSTTKYPAMVVMKNYIQNVVFGAMDESY